MRRIFITLTFLTCAQPALAQNAVDIFGNILGIAAGEIERQEQQKQYALRIEQHKRSLWEACKQGNVSACDERARYPMTTKARRTLNKTRASANAQRNTYKADHVACHSGNAIACDRAIAFPYATDIQSLQASRLAARANLQKAQKRHSTITRLDRDCKAGQLSACDEALARHDLSPLERAAFSQNRQNLFGSVQAHGNPPSPKRVIRPPITQKTSASNATKATQANSGPSVSFVMLALVAMATLAYALLRKPDPLSPEHGAIALFRNVRGLFERTPQPPKEHPTVLDDRDLLVRGGSSTPNVAPAEPEHRELLMKPGHDQIKLKIRRQQATGLTGKVTFSVNFIAELSPEAREAVRRYRFGKIVLYAKDPELEFTMNFVGLAWRMFWLWLMRTRWQITIADLVSGRTIECKDILEVLDVEDRIMRAARQFAQVLRAASWFGGEELVEL